MNILSVRNLKKYYNTGENTVKALDGIDLDICKGEFLAVVGTSGSGKSTLQISKSLQIGRAHV